MQIPILSGIRTDESSDFRTAYPRNMVPVPKGQGISGGYLRPSDGIEEVGVGAGQDRGAIEYFGVCYRVMGSKLVRINPDFSIDVLADVGAGGQVSLDYSFDKLAIASSNKLFYWDGTLQEVTDPDLGIVKDVIWVDGYFMTTDGEFLVVTELNNPTDVDPLKYGSSESDPDPIIAIKKIRNEPYAVNRYSVEVFNNIGGTGFPFQRVDGAQITKGSIGTHCVAVFMDALAFVGGGRKESIAIWLASSGRSRKISTREIDQILHAYPESDLSNSVLETKIDNNHQHLLLHLPDQTLVFDASATEALGQPTWFILTSGLKNKGAYRARNFIWCHNKWIVGDPTGDKVGVLSDKISTHYGEKITWEFSTSIIYNEGRGAIFNELELVALTGRVKLGDYPVISTQYSADGEFWSQKRAIKVGKIGERRKRLVWLNQGHMRNWRIQRFSGDSDTHLSFARLEAKIEALAV